jgi:hypothetical protein
LTARDVLQWTFSLFAALRSGMISSGCRDVKRGRSEASRISFSLAFLGRFDARA